MKFRFRQSRNGFKPAFSPQAKWLETTPKGISWLGFFYGGNIAGAVMGCLLAGFYLLRVYDMATATCVAAAVNGTVALIAFSLSTLTTHHARVDMRSPVAVARPVDRWTVFVAIALSGLCALGAEVIWTRLLSLILGGTVYAFSIILAVFLAGLGMGSTGGSLLTRGTLPPRMALCGCQMLQAAAIAWTAFIIAKSLPYWPINPSLSPSPWITFQVDLLASYAGRGADLRPWLKDAPINRDRNLRLQYLAGLSLNSDQSERIYQDLMQYRTFPDDLFVASDQRMRALRKALRLTTAHP